MEVFFLFPHHFRTKLCAIIGLTNLIQRRGLNLDGATKQKPTMVFIVTLAQTQPTHPLAQRTALGGTARQHA